MPCPSLVSAVIPAQNEGATIGQVVRDLSVGVPGLTEIIVVDDGSEDKTASVAESAGARVIRHPVPRGYGASLKTGILAAESEFVLTCDGDGQHSLQGIKRFLELLELAETQDLVAGHRKYWLHSNLWRLPGKWLLTRLSSYLVRQKIPDLNCGLRLYRRSVILRYLPLCANGYSFTATSLVLLLSWGYRVSYVPIEVSPNSSQGRITVRTGLDTLMLLLRIATLVDPLRFFLPMSAWVFIGGIFWGVPYALAGRGVSVGALLLLLTALLLFAVGLLSDQIAQLRKEQLERDFSRKNASTPIPVESSQ